MPVFSGSINAVDCINCLNVQMGNYEWFGVPMTSPALLNVKYPNDASAAGDGDES